jgi:hypothetical protein
MSAGRKIYLVVRYTWDRYRDDLHRNGDERVPVRGFTSKKDAEALCCELDAEFRRNNDVWTWFANSWSTEDCDLIKAAAVGLKIIPPATDSWGWWKSLTSPLTPEQRAALWDAVPGCNAYEVIETRLTN